MVRSEPVLRAFCPLGKWAGPAPGGTPRAATGVASAHAGSGLQPAADFLTCWKVLGGLPPALGVVTGACGTGQAGASPQRNRAGVSTPARLCCPHLRPFSTRPRATGPDGLHQSDLTPCPHGTVSMSKLMPAAHTECGPSWGLSPSYEEATAPRSRPLQCWGHRAGRWLASGR